MARQRRYLAGMASLLRSLAVALALASPALGDEASALRAALTQAADRDWATASVTASGAGAIGQDVIEWMRLRDGQGTLTDYEGFVARHRDWPGLALLRQKGEVAVARSSTPGRVIAWFGAAAPATPTGSMALIRALDATGQVEAAAAEARRAWVAMAFDAGEEEAFLTLAGNAVKGTHGARMDRLLWDARLVEARRMLPRVDAGTRALAAARIALMAGEDGVNAKIAAIPAALAGDPGLAHDRFQWRMDKGMYDTAAELILERSAAATLGDPAAWAKRRASLARELNEQGQTRTAYRIAAGHGLTSGQDFADLEFLSGFIALRRLNDPATALQHFRRLQAAVSTPISLSRALYWQGRALEAAGDAAGASATLEEAAQYQSAYYGLLAAERLGLALDARLVEGTRAADWAQATFARSTVFAAGQALAEAGDRNLAKRFFLHLAEGLAAPELAQLAEAAREMGEPHIALVVAKQAAEQGAILPDAYFPVVGMVPDNLSVSRALALSIARRESEFDPAVVSPAGAMGLMQVMPGTAKEMAKETGQPYAKGRLTGDPAYNVSLGAAYLKKLVDEFGPAVALVAAGYNAGPGRPRRWVQAFGDPRDPSVDVVDWVEMIPISETRTYVMRVAESLVIYRARLKGEAGPVRLTSELTGR